jgi:NAD(P)-dependent dehydrogenase (short-subunit alcohol dehydrogenase family)
VDLNGKVAIVTGAGSGIGHSIAERFAAAGASVCVNYLGYEDEMRNAALELAQYGIRVNNVAPGAIATPINAMTLNDPGKVATLRRIIPLMRMGTPE